MKIILSLCVWFDEVKSQRGTIYSHAKDSGFLFIFGLKPTKRVSVSNLIRELILCWRDHKESEVRQVQDEEATK